MSVGRSMTVQSLCTCLRITRLRRVSIYCDARGEGVESVCRCEQTGLARSWVWYIWYAPLILLHLSTLWVPRLCIGAAEQSHHPDSDA